MRRDEPSISHQPGQCQLRPLQSVLQPERLELHVFDGPGFCLHIQRHYQRQQFGPVHWGGERGLWLQQHVYKCVRRRGNRESVQHQLRSDRSLRFNTASGPDLATGLGTINAYNLVNNWGPAVGAFTPTATTLCLSMAAIPTTTTSCSFPQASPLTITHGTPVYVNMQVNAGGNPIPVTETYPPTANWSTLILIFRPLLRTSHWLARSGQL